MGKLMILSVSRQETGGQRNMREWWNWQTRQIQVLVLIPGVGVRLPPRAPYETAERLSLFCQSILDRKAENPWISCVFRNPGDYLYLLGDCGLFASIVACYCRFGRQMGGGRRNECSNIARLTSTSIFRKNKKGQGMYPCPSILVNVKFHCIVTVHNCCISFVEVLRERLQTARRIGS